MRISHWPPLPSAHPRRLRHHPPRRRLVPRRRRQRPQRRRQRRQLRLLRRPRRLHRAARAPVSPLGTLLPPMSVARPLRTAATSGLPSGGPRTIFRAELLGEFLLLQLHSASYMITNFMSNSLQCLDPRGCLLIARAFLTVVSISDAYMYLYCSKHRPNRITSNLGLSQLVRI